MQTNNAKQIEDLGDGKWVTLEVTFLQEWENDHDAIRQIGLLQDDTGIIKFVAWEKSNLPLLEEGVRYRLGKVPVSKYEDYLQIALVKTTIIERLDPVQTELPKV